MKKSGIRLWDVLMDALIDFALMGTGFLIYYQFQIQPLVPVGLHPALASLLGGKDTAVLIIAGLPFVIGLLNVIRLFFRILSGMAVALQRSTN